MAISTFETLPTIFKRWYPDIDLEVEEIPIAA
jgi:hypothetical protein